MKIDNIGTYSGDITRSSAHEHCVSECDRHQAFHTAAGEGVGEHQHGEISVGSVNAEVDRRYF